MSNTEQTGTEQKGSSNRFKKAAERQKKTAGGKPEELTAGATVTGEEIPAAVPEVPVVPAVPVVQEQVTPVPPVTEVMQPVSEPVPPSLSQAYQATLPAKPEARTSRLQVVITPTLDKKLNDLAKGRIPGQTIQSKNDLMNFLLERYFEEIGL